MILSLSLLDFTKYYNCLHYKIGSIFLSRFEKGGETVWNRTADSKMKWMNPEAEQGENRGTMELL